MKNQEMVFDDGDILTFTCGSRDDIGAFAPVVRLFRGGRLAYVKSGKVGMSDLEESRLYADEILYYLNVIVGDVESPRHGTVRGSGSGGKAPGRDTMNKTEALKMKQLETIVLTFFNELSCLDSDYDEGSGSVPAVEEIRYAAADARNKLTDILREERIKNWTPKEPTKCPHRGSGAELLRRTLVRNLGRFGSYLIFRDSCHPSDDHEE